MSEDPRPSDTDRSVGVTIGDVVGGIWNSIIAGGDVIVQAFTDSDERRLQRNRHTLLQRVKDHWIEGVLERSLHHGPMIELEIEECSKAVEHSWETIIHIPDSLNRQLPPTAKIIDLFEKTYGSLLILGEPGSGKTTMLLDLAHDAIAHAETNPNQPIPVVFNLSSWAEERQPLDEWLIDQLMTRYQVSKRFASFWIEQEELLLLLDGLDEVEREHQPACVQAINNFREEHGFTSLAICSRVSVYESLKVRLNIQNAVVLQTLTPEQIDHHLERIGPEVGALRETLQLDPKLQDLAKKPLMLSVMKLAYQSASTDDLPSSESRAAIRRHIFDAYIDRMFTRFARTNKGRYSKEQVLGWLAWFARKMEERSQSKFLIEDMQPVLLEGDGYQRYARFVTGLFWLLVVLVTVLVLVALSLQQILWLTGGILTTFIITWRASRSLRWKAIQRVEQLSWSWDKATEALIVSMPMGMIAMRLFGWAAGATVGRIISLAIVLTSAFIGGLLLEKIPKKNEPNQGIRRSGRNALGSFLIVALIGGLIIGVIEGPMIGTIFGLAIGLLNGLIVGGLAFTQHVILRFVLYRSGHIPWNLKHFLNYATERIFLYRAGGEYMFIHSLVQEHFAAMYEETA